MKANSFSFGGIPTLLFIAALACPVASAQTLYDFGNPPEIVLNNAAVTVNEGEVAFNAGSVFDPEGDAVNLTASFGDLTITPASGAGSLFDSGQRLGSDAASEAALADLDGDGDLDVFVANGGANTVWLNDGNGIFTDSGQRLGTSASSGVALGDLDGDNDVDAFVVNSRAPGGKVWFNDGAGVFTDSGQLLLRIWHFDAALADLDGDGDLDAFFAGGPNQVWLNDGAGFFTDSGQDLEHGLSVGLIDLDGDNDVDAFTTGYTQWSQPSKTWMNDGNGVFTDSGAMLAAGSGADIAFGDVDGDDVPDAMIAVSDGGADQLWLDMGGGAFLPGILGAPDASDSHGVALADLNGDGRLDAFFANLDWTNTVRLNNGFGEFTNSTLNIGVSLRTVDAVFGDLDGDNDLDLFLANSGEPDEVWLNGAAGGAWSWSAPALDGPDDSRTVTLTATDDNGHESTATFELVVNNLPPVANHDTFTILEDASLSGNVLADNGAGADSDVPGDTLIVDTSVERASNVGEVTLSANGGCHVTLKPDSVDDATFIYRVFDKDGDASTALVTIHVTPVNDPPLFLVGADQTVTHDAGRQSIPGWATGIAAGPPDESGQSLAFLVSNDHYALFAEAPAVSPDGTLTFTPAADMSGVANVTVRLKDNGGVANGGNDTSAARVFAINVVTAMPGPPVADFGGYGGSKGLVRSVSIDPDGKILIGGDFIAIDNRTQVSLARLHSNGRRDQTLPVVGVNSSVIDAVTQPDGKIVAVGNFTRFQGVIKNRIVRTSANGLIDAGFNQGTAANGWIASVDLQSDGGIVVGGVFTTWTDVTRNRVARLLADGSLDQGFDPGGGPNGPVYAVKVLPDGAVLIGGEFTEVAGTARRSLARLNVDGSLDASFDTGSGPNGAVRDIEILPDGKVLVVGDFRSVDGVSRTRIARLMREGGLDEDFAADLNINGAIRSLALQPNGKIVVGGDFSSVDGESRRYLTRLLPEGAPDGSFDPGSGPNKRVYDVALDADGSIVIVGEFTHVDGVARPGVARLAGDPPPPARTVTIADVDPSQGGSVTVPVALESEGDENALSFSVGFDPAVFANPVVAFGADAAGAILLVNDRDAEAGRLGLAVALAVDEAWLAGTREIVTLTFDVAMDATSGASPIVFGDDPAARGVSDALGHALPAVWRSGAATLGNRAPTAVADDVAGVQNQPLSFAASLLTLNDTDPDAGDTLSVVSVDAASAEGGTVSFDGVTIVYQSPADFNGPDTFGYTIADDGAPQPLTATGTVTVNVAVVNQPPIAVDDNRSVLGASALIPAVELLLNDLPGPHGESAQQLAVIAVQSPTENGGTVTLVDGEIVYTPPPGFSGPDRFTYTITDDGTSDGMPDPKTAEATVHLVVGQVSLEGDVATRPGGDFILDAMDIAQAGRFVIGLDVVSSPEEFQRLDAAPRDIDGALSLGNGVIDIADYTQIARYVAGLDPATPDGGPDGSAGIQDVVRSAASTGIAKAGTALVAGARLTLDDCVVVAGQRLDVPVRLDSVGVPALTFSLEFDATLLDFAGVTTELPASAGTVIVNSDLAAAGRLGVVVYAPPGTTLPAGALELLTISFLSEVPPATTASPLRFADGPVRRAVADARSGAGAADFIGGTIKVSRSARLGGMEWADAGGGLRLTFAGIPGQSYILQASKDLVHWVDVATARADLGIVAVGDLDAGIHERRYYRLKAVGDGSSGK